MARLVWALERLAVSHPNLGPFVIQHGYSPMPTRWSGSAMMDPDAMSAAVSQASVVITHGGPATVALCRSCGKIPIVVPRLSRHGEHVDDHQLWYARRLRDVGEVILVEDLHQLESAVVDHAAWIKGLPPAVAHDGSPAVSEFSALATTVLGRRRES
jgi:UDP-N-acetylglucosamine transferase subunit ALG13